MENFPIWTAAVPRICVRPQFDNFLPPDLFNSPIYMGELKRSRGIGLLYLILRAAPKLNNFIPLDLFNSPIYIGELKRSGGIGRLELILRTAPIYFPYIYGGNKKVRGYWAIIVDFACGPN